MYIQTRLILVSFAVLSTALVCRGIEPNETLQDGFDLSGVDGILFQKENKSWDFELESELADGQVVLPAGTRLMILPSAALEAIIADTNSRTDPSYRIWGTATKYEKQNFIFMIHFLALSKVRQPTAKSESPPSEKVTVTINEPNDMLAIPDDIIKKLKTRNSVQPYEIKKAIELKEDFLLVDRAGYFIKDKDGGFHFVPDGLGKEISNLSFRLLPCQILEQVCLTQQAELERLRFRVSGLVTQYDGKSYILLQKAIRLYGHGNFGK